MSQWDNQHPNQQEPPRCPNCGATNPPGAERCRACGMALDDDTPTIIDVTSSEPHILPTEPDEEPSPRWQGGFTSIGSSRGRVIVGRGGSRTCLLIAAAVLLVSCCVCWALWTTVGNIF